MKKIILLVVLLLSSCNKSNVERYPNVYYKTDINSGKTLITYNDKKWNIYNLTFVYETEYSSFVNIFFVFNGVNNTTYKLVVYKR